MATETETGLTGHPRSVAVTTIAALGGVAAGLLSGYLAAGNPTAQVGLVIVVGITIANLGLMRLVGVDVSEFGTKDHLYNAFMTVSLWYVTWGVLLTTDVTF
jgi:hypothetical protein